MSGRKRTRKTIRKREPKPKAETKTLYVKVLGVEDGKPTCEYFRVKGVRRTRITSREFYSSSLCARRLARGQAHERVMKHNGERVKIKGAGHCWPLKCEAMAVHPSQVAEMTAHNKLHGVNVTYDPKWGTAIIPDRGEYKKFQKLYGVHERNSYS